MPHTPPSPSATDLKAHKNTAVQSALSNFNVVDNKLVISGQTVSQLSEAHGTPLYIYDSAVIKDRHDALRRLFPRSLKISYAVKANPNREILGLMAALYDGVDVASAGEIERCIHAGISPSGMNFAGPGKRRLEIESAIDVSIGGISVESEKEISHILEICTRKNTAADILIRVNTDFRLGRCGLQMGGTAGPFGIDIETVPALLKRYMHQSTLNVLGLHFYIGTQVLDAGSVTAYIDSVMNCAASLAAEVPILFKKVIIGGGFGIPYFSQDAPLDLAAVGHGFRKGLERYADKLPNTQFWLELGRYLVGESGAYVTRVLYRKKSRGKTFIVFDGGMHHHLAASGNLGQGMLKRAMPIVIANRIDGPAETVTLAGPLCTALDTFGTHSLPSPKEGDLVAVLNAGAYGLSASPVHFLSHTPPSEILLS